MTDPKSHSENEMNNEEMKAKVKELVNAEADIHAQQAYDMGAHVAEPTIDRVVKAYHALGFIFEDVPEWSVLNSQLGFGDPERVMETKFRCCEEKNKGEQRP